jgi:hypothetical protein
MSLFNFDLSNAYPENTLRRKIRLLSEAIRMTRSMDDVLLILKRLVPLGIVRKLKPVMSGRNLE